MRRFSVDHIESPRESVPFWMPWGFWPWLGKSLLFLALLLGFLTLFCLPDDLRWLLWLLLFLLLLWLFLNYLRKHAPEPHTGDVQILLEWETSDDLDLHVVDPSGEEIFYKNRRSASGGELDVDANAGDSRDRHPKENVYWPHGGASKGHYDVYVVLFSLRTRVPVRFKVMVKYGSQTKHFRGTLTSESERRHIYSFDFE